MRIILVGYLVCVGFIVLGETRTENNFDGANAICWKVEEFHAQEPVNNTKTVKMRSQSWCFSIPPRCTTYKEESIFVVQIQVRMIKKKPKSDKRIMIVSQSTCDHCIIGKNIKSSVQRIII